MNNEQNAIRSYFAKLGLEPEVADIYAALRAHGAQTISELARTSNVERTHIYRLTPTLTRHNLIEIQSDYKHGIYKAAPVNNLQILLLKQEQTLQSLQDDLPLLERALSETAMQSAATQVQFYRGEEGVKQMLWNETKAQSEVLGIMYENIQIRTKNKFFERWAEVCNQNNLYFRGIVSNSFLASQQEWYRGNVKERLQHWESRYVSPEIFAINHSTIVYNDVVAYFNWHGGEIYGIEIHNREIADSQRQVFELLWEKASPNRL